jgi:hypothetical protein
MRRFAWAGVAAAIAATPAIAFGQSCIGVPISPGQFAIAGEIGFPEGGKSYGGMVTANVAGPLAVQARVDVLKADDVPEGVDDSATQFGGTLAYKIGQTTAISFCPLVGASYVKESFDDDEGSVSVSLLTIPVGIGFGAALPVSGLDLTAFAVPQLLIMRARVEMDIPGLIEFSDSETETEFGANLGLRLRTGPVYFGGSVFITSIEDSDPAFSLTVGFALGGRR